MLAYNVYFCVHIKHFLLFQMKNIRDLLLLLLLVGLTSGCKKAREKAHAPISLSATPEKQNLLKVYEKPIRAYYEELSDVGMDGIEVMSRKDQVEYTDIAIELIHEALKKRGYQPVDDETARKAILKYYGVDIAQSNSILAQQGFRSFIFKDGDPAERKRQELSMNQNCCSEASYFWNKTIYVSHYNYIFSYPTIDAAVAIKGLPDIFEEDYDATLFKRGKLYYRLLNKETYYENEFIFHDSKKAFAWLKNNSFGFLTNLLQKYGYDKNEEINRLLLDYMLVQYETVVRSYILKETFAIKKKTKHPHVEIREGLLKSVLKLPAKAEYAKIISLINTYIKYMMGEDEEGTPDWAEEFTLEECYKVAAYLCYYQYLFCKKFGVEETELLGQALYDHESFRDYIAAKNYFNLKGFKALCKKAYDKVGASEKLKKEDDE